MPCNLHAIQKTVPSLITLRIESDHNQKNGTNFSETSTKTLVERSLSSNSRPKNPQQLSGGGGSSSDLGSAYWLYPSYYIPPTRPVLPSSDHLSTTPSLFFVQCDIRTSSSPEVKNDGFFGSLKNFLGT